jgi:hypothetical protein
LLWLLLLLRLLRLLRLWLRRAGLAERVACRRTYSAYSTWAYWLADSLLLALRIERLLHIRSGFFERIPDEFPLNILFAVVVDLLRRRVHFAGNAGKERAKYRAVDRACRLLQVRGISGLSVQRTEWVLSGSYSRLAWGAWLA